jgi:phospholipid-binding lipoprotein MlaA
MHIRSDQHLRARLLIALLILAALPVWAQQPITTAATTTEDAASPPAAEPTKPQPAQTPAQAAEDAQLPPYLQENPDAEANGAVFDPWEHYNRKIYRFNKKVDKAIAKPLALAYIKVVPQPVRTGIGHFYQNLLQPVTAVNLLLQGHPGSAGKSLGRFAVNTTIGIGGLFDPATKMHIPPFNEDFGQTLGRWGWRKSRYFLLPFLGPGTLRDRVGSVTDGALFGPYKFINPADLRYGLVGLSLVDTRVQILPLDELSAGIDDDYILVREAWSQRRNHQIDDQTVNITDEAAEKPEAPKTDGDQPVKQ